MNLETVAPRVGHKTLLYSELVTNLAGIQADLAVIGMPFGAAYTPRAYSNDQSNAPQALRELSDRMVRAPEHYDFDIDGPLLQGRKDIRFVDCGDILPSLTEPREHYHKLEAAIKQALRVAATQEQISNEADFSALANILLCYVVGRWLQYAKSGFTREPTANWAQQWPMLCVTCLSQRKA